MVITRRAGINVRTGHARRTAALLLLGLGLARPGSAQDGPRRQSLAGDLGDAAGDLIHVWSSPLRVGTSDLPALIAATGATVVIGSFDGEIQRWVREHPSALPMRLLEPLQEPRPLSYFGRSFLLQPLSVLLYATGAALDSDALREAGLGCATANIANSLPRHAIGRLTGRLRPRYRGGPYDFDPFAWSAWPRRSFPGGHGSNIMACASYWNHRFDLGVAGPLLYTFAVAIGAARITEEAHWASDTVFGSILGWAVGREIANRFSGRKADDRAPGETASVVYIGWRIPIP